MKRKKGNNQVRNSHAQDSAGKLAFENPVLCAQLLRDYSGLDILKDVRPEDIIDETERFIPMFTEERASDVVKRILLRDGSPMFIVSLIEHKSSPEFDVTMQMMRYMTYIWEEVGKQAEHKRKGITSTKDFRYPPILPIVYYEGAEEWTPVTNFKDRISDSGMFSKYIPDWEYVLVNIHGMSEEEIIRKNNELSLLMLVNRLQSSEDFANLSLPDDFVTNIAKNASDEVLDIFVKVFSTLLRRINVPENDITGFTNQIKERKMGQLFENFKGYDWQATRAEALAEGRAEGRSMERDIINQLNSVLLKNGRIDDLKRCVTDVEYQNDLIRELLPEKWELLYGNINT